MVDEEAEGPQEVEGEEVVVDLGAVAEEVAVEVFENPEKPSIDEKSQQGRLSRNKTVRAYGIVQVQRHM